MHNDPLQTIAACEGSHPDRMLSSGAVRPASASTGAVMANSNLAHHAARCGLNPKWPTHLAKRTRPQAVWKILPKSQLSSAILAIDVTSEPRWSPLQNAEYVADGNAGVTLRASSAPDSIIGARHFFGR